MTDAATLPDEGRVLYFRDGIPGFPSCERFQLSSLAEDGAFQLLASLDDPDVAMIVSAPWPFFPDYAPEIGEEDQRDLAISEPEDAVVFCPVTVDEDRVFLNLLGPFVVNARTLEGRQVVLDSDQPLRAAVPIELGA